MNLIAVPPDRAGEFLPLVANRITRAIDRVGLSDADPVLAEVSAGRFLLWLAVDEGNNIVGAGVTQLAQEQAGRVCIIVAWGCDDQARCAPLLSVIEDFARDEGCVAVRLYGRRGWLRRLPDYKLRAVVLERSL